MGKNSKIEWTHHTFNPWWGCTRVSAACTHCYAEAWAKRVGQKIWGPSSLSDWGLISMCQQFCCGLSG
jgi:Protein of unknown function (DUF5131)